MKAVFALLVFGILLLGCAQQAGTGNGEPGTGGRTGGSGGRVVGVGETTGASETGNREPGTGGSGGAIVGIEQPEPGEGDITVYIRNNRFEPETVTVRQGSTVFWVNEDTTPHAVRMVGVFDSPYIGKGGGPYWHTFTVDPGEYEYSCSIHPSMRGKVIVVR